MSEQLIQTPGTFGENGNFLLERELGSGGMGGVYMGRDKMLDRPVAVKVMLKKLGADAEFVEKFKREAQSAARLIHPNIAQVYSYGICDGMPYIAMELAAGGSLYSIMNANPGKTDVARVLKICQQVAQALQCASDQGCVHGDVKPENILLDANGNAKLVDFGLAAMQKDTSEIWGTPYYISPEKVKKEPIDFRADMYSLGGTLYHALTGVAPFEGVDSVAVVKKRFEGAPKKPSEVRPDLTPPIDELVMKMLALKKEDRFPSFEALIEKIHSVLTTGLTASAAPQEKKTAAATGAKKMTTIRGRRTTIRRTGMSAVRKPVTAVADDDIPDEEEEDEGGSIGAKVVGAVIGGLLLIGGVIGGLVWYQVADKKARAAEAQAQIVGQIANAREAIASTRKAALKFDDEFREFAVSAETECQRITKELKKLMPDWADQFQPPPSDELVKAWALTNEVAQAQAAATNGPSATATAATNAPAAAVASGAPAAGVRKFDNVREEAKSYGIEVPEGDLDPASPEGEEFYKKLKEARKKAREAAAEAAKKKAEEKKAAEEKANASAGDAPSDAKEAKKAPAVLDDIHELWNRGYSCAACQIRLSLAVKKVLAECDKANEIKDETEESMRALGELSLSVKDLYDQLVASKDVEAVRKGIGFIKSKGRKVVEQTVKRLRIEKLEADRKARNEAAAAAEKARLEKQAAERKALIEKETTEIRGKFDMIVTQGCLRQLDWKSAIRQLETRKADFQTPEGQLAADLEIRKVNDMKKVHDLFVKGLKGHVFKGKLKGAQVTDVNEKEIILLKADGKTKLKISWQKFYKDYPGNLNELMNLFVVNARQPTSKHRISSLKDWADAMTGAALTMKLVCSEVNGAIEKSETLAKETVKEFPDYLKTAKEIFPDVKFDEAAAEE